MPFFNCVCKGKDIFLFLQMLGILFLDKNLSFKFKWLALNNLMSYEMQ